MTANFRSKWWVLAVVQLGVLLCAVDVTIILFALPMIASELKLSFGQVQWISVAYTITCGATLSLAGKLADLFGRKRAYMTGFAIFTLASLVSGLASNLGLLVAMRVLTGFGTAFLLSSSSVITIAVFPKAQHGLALGISATVFSVGFGLGLSLGSFIVQIASWRWIFLINLPIGLFALLAGAFVFDPAAIGQARPRTKPLDFAGAITLMVCLTTLLLGLDSLSSSIQWTGCMMVAVSLVAGFCFWMAERSAADPILPFSLFKIQEISIGSVTRIIMRMAGSGTSFTMPFYLQHNFGLAPSKAGMLMLANVIAFAAGGPLAGHAADRLGARRVIILGLVCLCGGTVLHFLLPNGMSTATTGYLLWVIAAQAMMGIGAGMFGSPNTSAAMQSVSPQQRGVASGLLWTTSFIGQAFGTALAAILLRGQAAAGGAVENQRWVFGVLSALVLAAIFLSFCRSSAPAPAQPSAAPQAA